MRLSRPRSRPTTTQKNLAVPGIEPVTSVSVARTPLLNLHSSSFGLTPLGWLYSTTLTPYF